MSGTLTALDDLQVVDSPSAYIQWLTHASDPITQVDGNNTIALDPYQGGPAILMSHSPGKALYIGVMCNRLTGYDLTLTATNSEATSTSTRLIVSGGSDLILSATLEKESGTFTGGATASTQLDLTGGSASGTAVFAENSDLPLTTIAPNVWKLTVMPPSISSVSNGLIMNGNYERGITASISLR